MHTRLNALSGLRVRQSSGLPVWTFMGRYSPKTENSAITRIHGQNEPPSRPFIDPPSVAPASCGQAALPHRRIQLPPKVPEVPPFQRMETDCTACTAPRSSSPPPKKSAPIAGQACALSLTWRACDESVEGPVRKQPSPCEEPARQGPTPNDRPQTIPRSPSTSRRRPWTARWIPRALRRHKGRPPSCDRS